MMFRAKITDQKNLIKKDFNKDEMAGRVGDIEFI